MDSLALADLIIKTKEYNSKIVDMVKKYIDKQSVFPKDNVQKAIYTS